MKASEVRIGNLVKYDKRVFEIDVIAHVFPTLNTAEFGIGVVDWNNIEPIPITEEWLFKFGFHLRDGFSNTFKLDVEKHQYDCSKITYSEKEGLLRFSNGKEKGTTLIPHIKYVHQLQNLYFALTGEELTIKQKEQ
jgi:hypothetical protein